MVASCPNPVQSLADAFVEANPHLQQSGGAADEPITEGGSVMVGQRNQAQRVIQAGGMLSSLLLHPSITPLEQIYRKLPPDGVFEATIREPLTFTIGAFTVPRGQSFVLAEYRFDIFRLDGSAAGNAVLLEERRVPTVIGYDLRFEEFRKGNLDYEILPINPSFSDDPSYGGVTGTGIDFQAPQVTFPVNFDTATQQLLQTVYGAPGTAPGVGALSESATNEQGSRVSASGAGSALIPQGQRMQGPSQFPFSFKLDANQTVQLSVTAFSPCRIPIAFFETRLSGYLVPTNAIKKLMAGVEPPW